MKLEWSPTARNRAAIVDAWWRDERPAAPDLFTRELIAALQQIRDFPEVPSVCGRVRGRPVRRVLLKKTRQHVYYLVDPVAGVVRIHAIRGTRRRPPPL